MTKQTERLSKIIEQTGLSTLAFSKEIGLSNPQRIYNVLKGKNKISPDLAKKIASKFDTISAVWIMSGADTLSQTITETQPHVSSEIDHLKEIIEHYKRREESLLDIIAVLKEQVQTLKEK